MVLLGRTTRVSIYATYISLCTFTYLSVLRYWDACLKSDALRVGMKTLQQWSSTGVPFTTPRGAAR